MNPSSIPLEDILPWSVEKGRIIAVCDSMEADGRFLLHTLAAQVLKSPNKGRILWLTGSPATPQQIATAMKRIGCDTAATWLRNRESPNLPSLEIRSLLLEFSAKLLDPKSESTTGEEFLKGVYHEIKAWTEKDGVAGGCDWIILDDVSTLATSVGDKIAYQFVHTLIAYLYRSEREERTGLLIRWSNDLDQKLLRDKLEIEKGVNKESLGWVGFGGSTHPDLQRGQEPDWIPWERFLVELVDTCIDVCPLESGYSREAHGRLLFTAFPGGREWGRDYVKMRGGVPNVSGAKYSVVNYCITDNGVRGILLRETRE